MSGSLGICLQGAHPDLVEGTKYDTNLAKKIHDVNVKVETYAIRADSHPEFYPTYNLSTTANDLKRSQNVVDVVVTSVRRLVTLTPLGMNKN